PESDVGLVAPSIAPTGVDGAVDALRVERVHERAGTIINRLPGDGSVVRVHNAVDKAERHPLGDQIRLGIRDRLQQSQIRIWRLSGGRLVPRNDVIGKQLQAINIVPYHKILKSLEPYVTSRTAG